MLLKTIGIISYLPDDGSVRKSRFEKLCGLIETCNQLFNLHIHVIIQNYKGEEETLRRFSNVSLSDNYGRCGIVGARRKLREWFLGSQYDTLIMLDDDCEVVGTKAGAREYLDAIDAHPGCFGEFRGSQLKLFCIDKSLMRRADFAEINPEDGDGFEDTVFVSSLERRFPKMMFSFSEVRNLRETSSGAGDELSTWYRGQDLRDMLRKTEEAKRKL